MKFEEHKIVQQVMRSRQDPEAAGSADPILYAIYQSRNRTLYPPSSG